MLERVIEGVALRKNSGGNARHIRFDGLKNFRDLGGYETADGRTVRWGRLYRSDSLHKLTDADHRRLQALEVGRVIDFRSEPEKQERPDRLPETIRYVEIPIWDASTRVWHEAREDMVKDMHKYDPVK